MKKVTYYQRIQMQVHPKLRLGLVQTLAMGMLVLSGCYDPCDDTVCLNGGACLNGDCVCPDGWVGENCQTPSNGISNPNDPCFGVICLNGGECVNGVCDCTNGYVGPDCSDFDPSVDVIITSAVLSGYSMTTAGSPWDESITGTSGPDIYLEIDQVSGSDFTSLLHPNASGQSINFLSPFPHTLYNPNQSITFRIWDMDDIDFTDLGSNDDIIHGGSINLWTQLIAINSNPYPSQVYINFPGSNCQIKLNLSYVW
jgi:hypothetical protein